MSDRGATRREGVLRIGAVPPFSGFMYAAVGSYMVRAYRLHDLRFSRYPKIWSTTVVAAAIYANFFTHHFIFDLRWVLLAAIALLWGRTFMYFRIWRVRMRAPQLLVFAGCRPLHLDRREHRHLGWRVALPEPRSRRWEPVSPQKLVSWFLLMIISVAMVTWVYPPKPPAGEDRPAA